jgi:hypothetical protein
VSGWETAGLTAFIVAWYGVPLYLAAASLPKHTDTTPTTRRSPSKPNPGTEPEEASAR